MVLLERKIKISKDIKLTCSNIGKTLPKESCVSYVQLLCRYNCVISSK